MSHPQAAAKHKIGPAQSTIGSTQSYCSTVAQNHNTIASCQHKQIPFHVGGITNGAFDVRLIALRQRP